MVVSDDFFMRRALELAALGRGTTAPNPMVGCVIVHAGKIIGEGWHQQYGGPHAEVNAIASVRNKQLLPASTLYVTLEPCSHYGKTPPCADLLVENKIERVVICNTDPNPLVSGNGIKKLTTAGVQVQVGLLELEGWALNKAFFTYHSRQRPYIILKWAETADGFIGRTDAAKLWISTKLSKKLVHKWRGELQAIMVGTRTVLKDNPQLNTREWTGKDPVRLVLDPNLRLPADLHIFDGRQPTFVYNLTKQETKPPTEWVKINDPTTFLIEVVQDLYRRSIQSVLVEGGTVLLESFISSGLWDEAFVFKGAKSLGLPGVPAPVLPNRYLQQVQKIAIDTLLIYKNFAQVTR